MAFSYKPLWKLLIDQEMTKRKLMEETGISKSTMDKMARGQNVSLDIVERLCRRFDCGISDILEYVHTERVK